MELFRLHYFLELCKVKQFTKAAENLAISQAALSKQIKILEATLGAELFNRQGQTTTLTPAGLILEKYCWRITNELVSIEEELKEINHSSNHIYVATYDNINGSFIQLTSPHYYYRKYSSILGNNGCRFWYFLC